MTDRSLEPLHPVARELTPPAGGLRAYPPVERWEDWEEFDPVAWPRRVKRQYSLIPTICFNCEAGCGLLAYVDRETLQIQKFEGNPVHPGSRGRNCAKGPATLNQVTDPERIRYPLRRVGPRGGGRWERVTWDEVLDDLGERAGRLRLLARDGPPLARSRERALYPAAVLAPGDRPLLQPARPADHRSEGARRQDRGLRHAAQQHRVDGRLVGRAVARVGVGGAPGDGAHPRAGEALRSGVRPSLGELGRVPA